MELPFTEQEKEALKKDLLDFVHRGSIMGEQTKQTNGGNQQSQKELWY